MEKRELKLLTGHLHPGCFAASRDQAGGRRGRQRPDQDSNWGLLLRSQSQGRWRGKQKQTRAGNDEFSIRSVVLPLLRVVPLMFGGCSEPEERQALLRSCVICGASLEGRRADARHCGAPCRAEASLLRAILRCKTSAPYGSCRGAPRGSPADLTKGLEKLNAEAASLQDRIAANMAVQRGASESGRKPGGFEGFLVIEVREDPIISQSVQPDRARAAGQSTRSCAPRGQSRSR